MNRLCIIGLIKAVILAWIIGAGVVGLAPDEAQYWAWSQELDWGYYSKPPGIAWQIWLTTSIFGNTPFGVRSGALMIGFLISLAVYGVARAADLSKKTSFWAGIIFAFCPLGIYLSFAAITDGGAILFLTSAAALVMRGLRVCSQTHNGLYSRLFFRRLHRREEGPHYLLAGFCILCGALFKWTAFIFWPIVFLFLPFFKNLRKWSLAGGVCISLIALLPTLYWNASHEWATFRHVGSTVGGISKGNFIDFLASQVGLLSPFFFVLLGVSYFFLKGERNRGLFFAAGFPLMALLYLVIALFKKMQPNWASYLYPAGLPLVAWIACDRLKTGRLWLHLGTWFSILTLSVLFAIPWLQESGAVPLSYKLNPFRQSVGWHRLGPALLEAGYHPKEDFLFADKYQAASLLSFYGPEQRRAYYFNLGKARKNQFSFWPQMREKEKGKTGYFVVLENITEASLNWYAGHYQEQLAPYFQSIHYKGAYPLYTAAGTPVKYAILFACTGYSGEVLSEIKKY